MATKKKAKKAKAPVTVTPVVTAKTEQVAKVAQKTSFLNLDSVFPFLVGNRTQLLAVSGVVLQLLNAFGVVDASTASTITSVLVPAGAATLAAKLTRGV